MTAPALASLDVRKSLDALRDEVIYETFLEESLYKRTQIPIRAVCPPRAEGE